MISLNVDIGYVWIPFFLVYYVKKGETSQRVQTVFRVEYSSPLRSPYISMYFQSQIFILELRVQKSC